VTQQRPSVEHITAPTSRGITSVWPGRPQEISLGFYANMPAQLKTVLRIAFFLGISSAAENCLTNRVDVDPSNG
jgi:hypothetical protein